MGSTAFPAYGRGWFPFGPGLYNHTENGRNLFKAAAGSDSLSDGVIELFHCRMVLKVPRRSSFRGIPVLQCLELVWKRTQLELAVPSTEADMT